MSIHSPPLAPAAHRAARIFHHAALLEGTTLVLLVVIAVPLKYLAGEPGLVKALGPLHGLAFLAYLWAWMQVRETAAWPRRRQAIALLLAFVPFGSFIALTRMGLARAGSGATDAT